MTYTIQKVGPKFSADRGVQTFVSGITVYHTGSARRDTATMLQVADAIIPRLTAKFGREYDRNEVATALKDRSHIMRGFSAQAELVSGPDMPAQAWLSYRTDTSGGSGPIENVIIL